MFIDDDVSKFTVLYNDEDIKVIAEIAPSFMDGVFIHTEVKTFSISKYKKYKKIWDSILTCLDAGSIKNIYALPTDDVAEKWETKFGFVDTGVYYEHQKIMKYVPRGV